MKWWTDTIEMLFANSRINHYESGSSLIYGPIIITDMNLNGVDPFDLCCYTNKEGKLTLLNRNYRNQESINEAKKKLKGSNSIVSVSLIGEKKHGSVKNKDFCMYTLFINKDEHRATVIFRNSDILKKLLIDVYWLKNCLFKELGIDDYRLDGVFNSVTLRAPFFYLYLNALKNKTKIEDTLSRDYPLVKKFKLWYSKPTPNYKSLERAGRRMRELDIYKTIEPYIKGEPSASI